MKKLIYTIVTENEIQDKLNRFLPEIKGIAGADLISVSCDQISAVVSDLEKPELITDQSKAIEYAGVIETLAQQFTLLPMRFGSVLESTELVDQMLERNYDEFRHNLQKVENKFEFGLKIFGDPLKLKAELSFESDKPTQSTSNPDTKINNSIYLKYVYEKLKEHRFEELLLTYIDSVIDEITVCLSRLNAECKFRKMTTATLVADAVFLLDKDKKHELVQAVEDIQDQYPSLNFILTGPWPPYSFVDVKIK
jgi:hypothetical protein